MRPALAGLVVAAALGPVLISGVTANPPVGKQYAVLVGVKDYDHARLPPLEYPENDVVAADALFRKAGYTTALLTNTAGKKEADKSPTLKNVRAALKDVLGKCKRHDLVVVGLAGHGLQFTDRKDSFFCPADGNPNDPATLLSLADVYKQLDESGAGVKLLLVDACRNAVPDPNRGSRSMDGSSLPLPPRGIAALFACSSGERAYEHEKYRHGVFFYHVLEGLRGGAKVPGGDEVTWDSLAAYVRYKVSRDVPGLVPGAKQTPTLTVNDLSGEPPVLVALPPAGGGGAAPGSPPDGGMAKVPRDSGTGDPWADLLWRTDPVGTADAKALGVSPWQPRVTFVVPGGGADQAGLRKGDVVLQIDGKEVEGKPGIWDTDWMTDTAANISRLLAGFGVEDRIKIVVLRDGERKALSGRYRSQLTDAEVIDRTQRLAEDDDSDAQLFLARVYASRGSGWWKRARAAPKPTPEEQAKDAERAGRWARKAVAAGNPYAAVDGLRGWAGHSSDQAAVRKAAEAGRVELFAIVGAGHVRRNEYDQALVWYRRAFDSGQMFVFGYEEGSGHSTADNNVYAILGRLYLSGSGSERNEKLAADVFRAADKPWALGMMAEFGIGGPVDYEEAGRQYDKANDRKAGDGSGYRAAKARLAAEQDKGYTGLKVSKVRPDGPAAKTGFKVGDVIIYDDFPHHRRRPPPPPKPAPPGDPPGPPPEQPRFARDRFGTLSAAGIGNYTDCIYVEAASGKHRYRMVPVALRHELIDYTRWVWVPDDFGIEGTWATVPLPK